MGDNVHSLIVDNILVNVTVELPDVIAIPPGATLITAADWYAMAVEAGGEEQLIALLGVEDQRGETRR